MTGRSLTGIHLLPQGQTLTVDYHINNILEACPSPYKREWSNRQAKIVQFQSPRAWRSSKTGRQRTQPRPPRHGAKKKNLSNFIEKTCWPPNSPDINPVENLWSLMDEVVYKDPTPKTMKDLKRRLKQAWKKIPLSTSRYMTFISHSMPQRLRNMISNKGGHAGYWISEYMYSVKQ